MGQVVNIIANQIDRNKIINNCHVTEINYSAKNKVKVMNSEGEGKEFDKCIVTVPLGILQSRENGIRFDPELPESKLKSILVMGPGVLDKLILHFSEVFWNPDIDWFNYISDEENYYDWTQTFNAYKFTGEPVLIMFNCEKSAHKFASFTDEELF